MRRLRTKSMGTVERNAFNSNALRTIIASAEVSLDMHTAGLSLMISPGGIGQSTDLGSCDSVSM